jgi:hypothetical protein
MKIKLHAEETYTTTVYREKMEIDTDNYPELEGMTEDEIGEYIDDNIWDMKPVNSDLYESLGEELLDKDIDSDHIGGEETVFYVS